MADEAIRYQFVADIGNLKAGVAELRESFASLGQAQDTVASASAKVTQAGEKQVTTFESLQAAGRAVGGRYSELGERVINLGRSLSTLPGVVTVVTAATAGYVAALGYLIVSADESTERLQKLGLITSQQASKMHAARDSVSALTDAFSILRFEVADKLSGAMQGLARWTLIAAMAMADLVSGEGFQGLEEYVRRVLELEEAERRLRTEVESLIPAFDALAAAEERINNAAMGLALLREEGVDRIRAEIEWTQALGAKQLEVFDQKTALMEAEDATADQLHARQLERWAIEEETELKLGTLRKRLGDETRKQLKAEQDARLQMAIMITSAFGQMSDELIKNEKARGIVGVLVNTAVGIMTSIAQLGPPIPPNFLGIAGVATVVAVGAAQLAAVASASPGGGAISAPSVSGGGASGPGVQTVSTTSGGNPGDYYGRGMVIQFRHQLYDAATRDAIRRDSPLSRRLRSEAEGQVSGRAG